MDIKLTAFINTKSFFYFSYSKSLMENVSQNIGWRNSLRSMFYDVLFCPSWFYAAYQFFLTEINAYYHVIISDIYPLSCQDYYTRDNITPGSAITVMIDVDGATTTNSPVSVVCSGRTIGTQSQVCTNVS